VVGADCGNVAGTVVPTAVDEVAFEAEVVEDDTTDDADVPATVVADASGRASLR
jgi:hypothetical protein